MSEPLTLDPSQLPDISNLVLEDDTPLDSFINEKQQRLLTTVLYSGGDTGITVPFIAAANVGLFSSVRQPGVAPDVFLSINITGAEDWWERQVRSYLFWEFGKPPEIAIEIVSPTPSNELGSKLIDYARMRIPYYVVYDPLRELRGSTLRIFELHNQSYVPKTDAWFPEVGLGLTLWQGEFENVTGTWLRWCSAGGASIPTGDELAVQKNTQLSQKDAQLSQKDAQLSQKDAQLLEERARTKQAFIQTIELGLRLKFGDEGLLLLEEILEISDVGVLQAIASDMLAAKNLDEIRQIYQS
ncbi:MAG: Uma2 family endonuclease [Microcoleus sp. PH2017_16_JOR_D_A]|uniref:Uma2 family endonuclease n=1 Tax=Microcoleus sp. PH2017_16_JOR_D_A TaxID=2798827 RepID=UPI001D721CC9|nr:Uma2 family endonuclease [Microcoleus sp. PH2017_16_JOR_D_A]MCC3491206.1 Uma2 family endonuclease [Microcoleus sp. PH2017_16_JOR_D_A]